MTELEEKKTVAEWMKFETKDSLGNDILEVGGYLTSWNPQSDKLATFAEWDEIYDKMTQLEWDNYMDILDFDTSTFLKIHLENPSIRWAALLQMIGEK